MAQATQQLDNYGYPAQPDKQWRMRKAGIRASKTVLLACIYVCLGMVGGVLWLSRIGKRYPRLKPETFQPRRILVIRLDLIGDLVLTMTLVRALKRTYPGAEIDLMAVPVSAKIVRHDPDLARVIEYDPNIWRRPRALFSLKNWRALRALLHTLHESRYDLAISVFGQWAGVAAVLSGAKRRLGFGRESYPGFMTDSVPGWHWKAGERKHEVDYCLELARGAGAVTDAADRVPHLYVDPQTRQECDQLLAREGIGPDALLVACHVSSNNGQSKRWPLSHWATLIDRLICEEGVSVVLTGAPDDLPLIEWVMERTRERPVNLAGKTSLAQLAALLQRADLFISGDSGPMHIAGAVGTPLIAIHGPTDPAHSGPVGPHATILKSNIWCSPCYMAKDTADCRFYTTQCMKNILPAQVCAVARTKLKKQIQSLQTERGKPEAPAVPGKEKYGNEIS